MFTSDGLKHPFAAYNVWKFVFYRVGSTCPTLSFNSSRHKSLAVPRKKVSSCTTNEWGKRSYPLR